MKISGLNPAFSYKYLLRKYGSESIFKIVFNEYPDLDKRYKSPFRDDNHPGCRFEEEGLWLYFIDNAGYEGRVKFNCFDVVQYYFKLKDFNTTISFIENYFNKSSIKLNKFKKKSKVIVPKFYPTIKFNSILFTEKNNPYKKWLLTHDQLNKDPETFLVSNYWCSTKKDINLVKNRFNNPYYITTIAYYFSKVNKTKLYWINKKEFKWFSNCSTNEIFNWSLLEQFTKSYLIITKSKKDAMILWYVFGIQAIAIQNETCLFPVDKLKIIASKFKFIYTLFDNDRTGYDQSIKYKKLYNFNNIKLPNMFNDMGHITEQLSNKIEIKKILKQCLYKMEVY